MTATQNFLATLEPKDMNSSASEMSRARLWTGRILSGLATAFLVMDGAMKLAKPAFVGAGDRAVGISRNHHRRHWDHAPRLHAAVCHSPNRGARSSAIDRLPGWGGCEQCTDRWVRCSTRCFRSSSRCCCGADCGSATAAFGIFFSAAGQRNRASVDWLYKSQLLFLGLRSTIPGFSQIGNRGAVRQMEIGRVCRKPAPRSAGKFRRENPCRSATRISRCRSEHSRSISGSGCSHWYESAAAIEFARTCRSSSSSSFDPAGISSRIASWIGATCVDKIQIANRAQQIEIGFARGPRRERRRRWAPASSRLPASAPRIPRNPRACALCQPREHRVIQRFHRAGDKQATGPCQHRQQHRGASADARP